MSISTVTALNNLTQLAAVRVVATANQSGTFFNGPINNGVGATFTYATGALTIDSVAIQLYDYVLLAGQTLGYQNGIYECTAQGATGVSAVLTRRGDFQTNEQIQRGAYVPVYAGTVYAGSIWTVVEPLPAGMGVPTTSGANNIIFDSATQSAGLGTAAAKAASNNALATVASVNTPTIIDHIATYADTNGTLKEDSATAINGGNIQAGLSGTAGTVGSFPSVATSGELILAAVTNGAGNFNTTISNAASVGQSQVVSIPDSGAATANFMLDAGTTTAKTITTLTSTTANITNLKYGATPVAQVDPASCTITAVAGAANVSTITVQLKDGSGTNMTRIIPFRVYSSSAADGLTLQGAASTGYSVASGGLSLNNGAAITTQISCMSSATGGCVLSLTDTGKQTSYLVLVLANGTKISAQLSAGSYG